MKPKVYIETTVISYLTARSSSDVVTCARQQITTKWWEKAADLFELTASQLVLNEVSSGDEEAAGNRLAALESITLFDATEEAYELARKLISAGAIPENAAEDAAHIAIAVTNGVEFLVTWNCRHIANAHMRPKIEATCRKSGYEPAIICTPEELMEPYYEYINR